MNALRLPAAAAALLCLALAGCTAEPEPETPQSSAAASPSTAAPAALSTGGWPRWGGPDGNFQVQAEGLADSWPTEGPPELWRRDLGAGYTSIVGDGERLYTMYRDKDDDVVVALDAGDGSTIWERKYGAPAPKMAEKSFGTGPNATPLLLRDRLITLSFSGLVHGLDRASGEILWSRDLMEELDAPVPEFGFSASPVLHDGNVIVLVGGKRQGVVALNPADGTEVWKSAPTSVSYATPIVIDVDGQEQIVYLSEDEILGLDAGNGSSLWSYPVVNQYRNNATGPIWGDDGLLWVASQLDGGTRGLRLTQTDGKTEVEQVWESNKLSVHYWNTLRVGDHVYASVGSTAALLAAIDMKTGEIAWRERGFDKLNLVHAGDKTVMLDVDGQLAIARLSPEGAEILSRTKLLEGPTWTAPTLVGTTLYVRDTKQILALDLS